VISELEKKVTAAIDRALPPMNISFGVFSGPVKVQSLPCSDKKALMKEISALVQDEVRGLVEALERVRGDAHLLRKAVSYKDHEREMLLRVGDIGTVTSIALAAWEAKTKEGA
jgi:RecA/RadA recombinase